MKRVSVFLADGFEEIEGLTVVDVLRRAGICVTTVSIKAEKEITGRSDIMVCADRLFDEVEYEKEDVLVLPGGMPGTANLQTYEPLAALLQKFYAEKKKLAAICAAPMVFGHLGFLEGREATIYPGMEAELKGAKALKKEVVVDEFITTSRGMGTAIPFALSLIRQLLGKEKAEEIRESIVYEVS